jgi:phospholipid/cholesterol/gamma-HCH transport system ATP-binding protein
MNSDPIISLKNISMLFGKHKVHKDITFSVNAGETLTIIGPSGTGKTLLLKMIVGLLKPTSGEVWVLGQPLHELDEDKLRNVRKNIGMLFQGAALFDSMTVYENVAYPLREYGATDENEISEIVEERLALVGLPGIQQKFPNQLSGGQKKRVGLARALASSPKIILFDEPTTGLDPTATRLIDDLIIKLKNELKITCVAVTHDIASAKRISDRWMLIDNGSVQAIGEVARISSESQQVKDFISGNWKNELVLT